MLCTSFVSLTALAAAVNGLPMKRDSGINEPAVSAPDGTILSATYPMATQAPAPPSKDPSGGCSGSDCGSGGMGDMSSSMMDTSVMMTSTMMDTSMMATETMMTSIATETMMDTSSMMDSSTMMTSMAMPTYGSGSSSWGSSDYNGCVQQCMMTYGAPPSMYTPPPMGSMGGMDGSGGSGTTHTVIVAPQQGVLRYVPFAVNASVGDTVRFVWGAGPHTVTKSSETTPCNATKQSPFASGKQNASFIFDQVVNDTNPTFFYCGIPNHCEQGMFGIINPPNGDVSSPSVASSMLASMASNSSTVASMLAYTQNMTSGVPAADSWGSMIDMSGVSSTDMQNFAENIMYTRLVMAANNGSITSTGGFNPSSNMTVPADISQMNTAPSSSAPASSPSAPVAAPANAASGSGSAPASSSTPTGAARRSTVLSSSASVIVVLASVLFFL